MILTAVLQQLNTDFTNVPHKLQSRNQKECKEEDKTPTHLILLPILYIPSRRMSRAWLWSCVESVGVAYASFSFSSWHKSGWVRKSEKILGKWQDWEKHETSLSFTHQLVGNGQKYVEALDAVWIVFPLAINYQTWLLQHPRKEVVVVTIINRIGRRRGRWLSWCILVQLVAIIT